MNMDKTLLGKIVDDVFDGAIEDASVIEDIYAAIKKHERAPAPVTRLAGEMDDLRSLGSTFLQALQKIAAQDDIEAAQLIACEALTWSKAKQSRVVPADLTNDQKEITLLRIIEAMGGKAEVSDNSRAWINWFCRDEQHGKHSDTYNRCIEKGWLDYSHDGDFDLSTAWLTKDGRAVLSAVEAE